MPHNNCFRGVKLMGRGIKRDGVVERKGHITVRCGGEGGGGGTGICKGGAIYEDRVLTKINKREFFLPTFYIYLRGPTGR